MTMKEAEFNAMEQDLVRWCYYTLAIHDLLARHFECTSQRFRKL